MTRAGVVHATAMVITAGFVLWGPGGDARVGGVGFASAQDGRDPATLVPIWDPTGAVPAEIVWPPHPATPPPGFHWQHTGSPAVKVDPATGQPLPGQFVGRWILVRDGHRMPTMK